MEVRTRKPKPMKSKHAKTMNHVESSIHPDSERQYEVFDEHIEKNKQILMDFFKNCSDVVFRQVQIQHHSSLLLVYVDGLIDTKVLEGMILNPLMSHGLPAPESLGDIQSVAEMIAKQMVPVGQTKLDKNVKNTVFSILTGCVAIFADGGNTALLAQIPGFEKRAIEEPPAEISVRGPRDGFTETLRDNTSMLRRRIQSPLLKLELLVIGELSHTDVVIAYIEGIAQDSIVEEVRRRVSRIQIDILLASGYLEEFIKTLPLLPSRRSRIRNVLMWQSVAC